MSDIAPGLDVIYDGDCIFCASYMKMIRLRRNVGEIRLHNARDADTTSRFPQAQQYDLDEGMLVHFEGRWFHGAEAVWLLSLLCKRAPLRSLLAHRNVARILYPAMRTARNVTLFVRGKSRLS